MLFWELINRELALAFKNSSRQIEFSYENIEICLMPKVASEEFLNVF